MIIPDRLLVGVPCEPGDVAPPVDLVEVAPVPDLPQPEAVSALAQGRGVTLLASPVITHRRTDRRYRLMASPPPEHAAVGHFERSRWTDEAWEATDALARQVEAQAAVLQTPASFKPTAEHATRLENFVAHAMRPGLQLAWEWAPGSWQAPKALALCEQIGAVPVVDPTDQVVPDGEYVYARFRGGRTGRATLDDDDLKAAALMLRDRIGWVVFSNASGARDARRFMDML